MSYHWREYAKRLTTPHQRHQLIMLREKMLGSFYEATAQYRVLPDFIIIGASRSGTTHLFNTLRYHPQVLPARIKEVKYFNDDEKYQQGEMKYRSYFPIESSVSENMVVGEASPNYLEDERCADRIQNLLPNVKLIVMLRNPTDRFISRYFYRKQKGIKNSLSLGAILADTKLQKEISKTHSYFKKLKKYDMYRQTGNLLVIKSGDYFQNPSTVLARVCTYLGIDPDVSLPSLQSRNEAKPTEEVPLAVREKLDELFAPDNQELYDYLSRDMKW